MTHFDLKAVATFGIAGNFTGHLEQAGEANDFTNIKTKDEKEPKGIFPTYIPNISTNQKVPSYLSIFPFDANQIIFPKSEKNIQIEPECAIIFKVQWNKIEGLVKSLSPVCFGASNDCSIRKEGAKKISCKKNWGSCSKGFSLNTINIDNFTEAGILNRYRITSFLVRDKQIFEYGENSAIKDYSYIYQKLNDWMINKFNYQKDEGPTENINLYLKEAQFPEYIMVSIGATRYTDFGENNYLVPGDKAAVILYPEDKYTTQDIIEMLKAENFENKDISALYQTIRENSK